LKKIIIKSHILPPEQQIILSNGDKFDSVIELYNLDNSLLGIYVCNVDSSNNLDGKVEIKNGLYKGKCIVSQKLGKSILITNQKGDITLPSLYPNPRHQNKYIATSILIHSTKGVYSDGSAGCVTIPINKFNNFINHFLVNEDCIIEKK